MNTAEQFAKQWNDDPRVSKHDAALLGYQLGLLNSKTEIESLKEQVRIMKEAMIQSRIDLEDDYFENWDVCVDNLKKALTQIEALEKR